MENQLPESSNNNKPTSELIYPPKFQVEDVKDHSLLIRSVFSLFIYLGVGYLLTGRLDVLVMIVAIVLLHEMGHFMAMRYYNYSDVSIFFIPLLGAFISGNKKEVSQKQNAVILLAGPLPGIILGLVFYFIDKNYNGIYWGNISLNLVSILLIWINAINLLPVFPLDGGQLLNRVFLDEEGFWSNLFIILSAAAVIWLAISIKFYILLFIPVMLFLRYWSTRKHINLEKKLLEEGIDLDKSYDELSDEEYWNIRAVIVKNVPSFENINSGPPFEYDVKEERVAQEVETVLQRNLLMDISPWEKIVVLFLWALTIASPWIFDIEFIFNTSIR